MSRYFRALAVDYDGTMTDVSVPDASVLRALARARREGWRLILVTGRRWAPLYALFPAAESVFDAIVAENGALVRMPGLGSRILAQPVAPELDTALAERSVPFVRGDVLLDTDARLDQTVLQVIARLGLDVQLVRNRKALMLLPPGVTKGTGLLEALRDLGISPHSTVSVGDAENDHALLETCELGVAVANAVPSLQAHADVVLSQPDGAGLVSLLEGPFLRSGFPVQPTRWRARLGAFAGGAPATIPGSQVNLLVTGGTRSGKSCLAGLLAERVVTMGYRLCVLDPEGDHVGLEALPRMVLVGGQDPIPDEQHLARLIRLGSVIADLSLVPQPERAVRCRQLLSALAAIRERTGAPHWIILDEAHLVPDVAELLSLTVEPSYGGLCLVTYRPQQLWGSTLATMDYVVAFPGAAPGSLEALRQAGFTTAGLQPAAGDVPERTALLLERTGGRAFTVDRRTSAHIRHWHKYRSGELPFHRRFFFRHGNRLTGAVAGGIAEFHGEIARAEGAVLRHHARQHDFSRWIGDVIGDASLAREIRNVEASLANGGDVAVCRQQLLAAIEAGYPAG